MNKQTLIKSSFDTSMTVEDFINIIVTHECNKRCSFCVDSYIGEQGFISLANVQKAIDYAVANNVSDVLLVGGEPTLHPEIVTIASMCKEAGRKVILTTNYTRPEVIRDLDGIVDCFNISFYQQKELPAQKDFKSDLTLTALIHRYQLQTKEKLDKFIDVHSPNIRVKFSTLDDCNEWTSKNKHVDYLDDLDCKSFPLFNEILAQEYRGCLIKRFDRIINEVADQSVKFHTQGEVIRSWVL